jgi:hypothetical protein
MEHALLDEWVEPVLVRGSGRSGISCWVPTIGIRECPDASAERPAHCFPRILANKPGAARREPLRSTAEAGGR